MEPATPGEDAESGRGLALIQALVTTVTFERQDGTNTWVLSRTSSQD
jgi:serine/threonine-protein kinase RsbW